MSCYLNQVKCSLFVYMRKIFNIFLAFVVLLTSSVSLANDEFPQQASEGGWANEPTTDADRGRERQLDIFDTEFEAAQRAWEESGDELPEGIKALQEFASVELKPTDDPEKTLKAVGSLLERARTEILVYDDTKLIAHILILGHHESLYTLLNDMVNRLCMEGDARQYRITISASPIPNASINPKTAELTINIGLLAMVRNLDELASVIAHEMTHQNKKILAAKEDDQEAKKVLDLLGSTKNLLAKQREELRADLGALERMIRAGYNPWAAYDFEKRITQFMQQFFGEKFSKYIYKLIFRKSYEYNVSHPAGEIRMAAAKAFIAERGLRVDISEATKKYHDFSGSLSLLRKRIQLYCLPVTSTWVRKGLYLFLIYKALAITGATDSETFQMMSASAGLALSAVADALASILNPIQSIVSSIDSLFDGDGMSLEEQKRVGAGLFIGFLSLCVSYIFGITYHDVVILSNPNMYKKLKKLRINNAILVKIGPNLLKSVQSGKYEMTLLIRMLPLVIENLNIIETLYKDNRGIAFFRFIDGLLAAKVQGLEFYYQLLCAVNEELVKVDERNKVEIRKSLLPMLDKTPPFVIERTDIRQELEKLVAAADIVQLIIGSEAGALHLLPIQRRLTLCRAALTWKPDTSPGLTLELIDRLVSEGLYDTASDLFSVHYDRIVSHVFSNENPDPRLAGMLTKAQNVIKKNSTLRPNSARRERYWDRRLIGARVGVSGKEITEQAGVMSLAFQTPVTTRVLPYAQYFAIRYWIDRKDHLSLRNFLEISFNSVSELKEFIDRELKPRNVDLLAFNHDFYAVITSHLHWVNSRADIDALIEGDYFWPRYGDDISTFGPLEVAFFDVLSGLSKKFPDIWKYEPGAAEKYHAMIIDCLERSNLYPQSYDEKFELWERLMKRGVTSVTDGLFEGLFEDGDDAQRARLNEASKRGKIWEQELKAKMVRWQLEKSSTYQELHTEKKPLKRKGLLLDIVKEVGASFPEPSVPI